MNKIIINICVGLLAIGLVYLGYQILGRQEINECHKWLNEAQEYNEYYITQWQKDQCDHYKIEINAQIK